MKIFEGDWHEVYFCKVCNVEISSWDKTMASVCPNCGEGRGQYGGIKCNTRVRKTIIRIPSFWNPREWGKGGKEVLYKDNLPGLEPITQVLPDNKDEGKSGLRKF